MHVRWSLARRDTASFFPLNIDIIERAVPTLIPATGAPLLVCEGSEDIVSGLRIHISAASLQHGFSVEILYLWGQGWSYACRRAR